MIWVDTEAVNEKGKPEAGKQRLTVGVAIFESYGHSDQQQPGVVDHLEFRTPGEFWEWVESKAIKGRALWVMAHNWNYDAGILNTSVELPQRGWELRKYINGKPPLIVRWWKAGASITMVDTLNYFMTSVAALGQATGLTKKAMPKADAPLAEWADYAWRDVEVIRGAFLAFRGFVREHNLGVMQATLASQAFTAYRHRFMPVPILIHDNEKAMVLERESYHGGRTEALWRGPVAGKGTLYKLDINSMYPAIMAREKLPYWIKAYYHGNDPLFKFDELVHTHSIVARCRIRTDEPVYGLVRDHKLLFPIGEFDTVLSTPELRYAIKAGHLLSVGSWAVYEQAVLFEGFVNFFFGLRHKFRAQGNGTFDYMAKILMNSLYGKWGQNGRKWQETNDYNWEYLNEGFAQNILGEDSPLVRLRQRLGRTQILIQEGESENSFPLIAAEITAYGRIWLWELMKEAGLEHVFYVDTDSLVVDQHGYDALLSRMDPKSLGALKMEQRILSAVFWAPKDYALDGDTKIKGVRKKSPKIIAQGSGVMPIEQNLFSQDMFRSWDYNLSKGVDGYVDVVPIQKRLSRENTKRIVYGNGWTNPIEVWE